MASLSARQTAPSSPDISPGVKAAIALAVGAALSALICVVALLYRATARHRRLLADLERRGITVSQPSVRERERSAGRRRQVLRRNSSTVYGATAGWDALQSHDDVRRAAAAGRCSAPPLATNFAASEGRTLLMSWPLSRRVSVGSVLQLKGSRTSNAPASPRRPRSRSRLPAPEAADHVDAPSRGAGRVAVPTATAATAEAAVEQQAGAPQPRRPRGAEHPHANLEAALPREARPRSRRAHGSIEPSAPRPGATTSTTAPYGAARATASADRDPAARIPRPLLRSRSLSCGGLPGPSPAAPAPPPPPGGGRSALRCSASSVESVNSSILAAGASPLAPGPGRTRLRGGTAVARARASHVFGPRPLSRQHGRAHRRSPQAAVRSGVDSPPASSATRSSAAGSRRGSPGLAASRTGAPHRTAPSQVDPYGSPAERRKAAVLRATSGNQAPPSRQLSQTSTRASSTRSSNGNPFQWDPSPLRTGKPSALKGSPGARKGHRRQHCVRISLAAPTILGPPSPPMDEIQEESPDPASQRPAPASGAFGFATPRCLPRAPSASPPAPGAGWSPASTRTSLTPSAAPPSASAHAGQERRPPSPAPGRCSSRSSDTSPSVTPSAASPGRGPARHATPAAARSRPTATPAVRVSRPSTEARLERTCPTSSAPPADGGLTEGPALQPAKPGAGAEAEAETARKSHDTDQRRGLTERHDPTNAQANVTFPPPAPPPPAVAPFDGFEKPTSPPLSPPAAPGGAPYPTPPGPRTSPHHPSRIPISPPCSPKTLRPRARPTATLDPAPLLLGAAPPAAAVDAVAGGTASGARLANPFVDAPTLAPTLCAPSVPPTPSLLLASGQQDDLGDLNDLRRQEVARRDRDGDLLSTSPPRSPSRSAGPARSPPGQRAQPRPAPHGPRTGPSKDLRRTAVVTSAASRPARRHRPEARHPALGREESPALAQPEGCARFLAIAGGSGLVDLDACGLPPHTTLRTSPEARRGAGARSVWDDGEKFWERPAGAGARGRADGDARRVETPPRGRTAAGAVLQTPGALAALQSLRGSPLSLYDQDGFLRT